MPFDGSMISRGRKRKDPSIGTLQRMHDREHHKRVRAAAEPDRGADGPAMMARGFQVEQILEEVCLDDGSTEMRYEAVARVRDGVIDHYVRINVLHGRRLDAMMELADLYAQAKIAPGTGRSFGSRGYGEMTEEQAEAWRKYCRASDHLSPGVRPTVEDVARGRYPAGRHAIDWLRQGSNELANYFRLMLDAEGA